MSIASSAASLRVMLVEDNPDHVLLIQHAIRDLGSGHRVEIMNDGEQALDTLRGRSEFPDLILLDISMPGYSGFEMLTQVRNDQRLMHIPIVMLTSSEAQSDIARAYELGASGYITKPSHFQDLRAVLANTMLYWSAMQRHSLADEEMEETS
ncbi:MAG: response regulator [Thermomicrobiales bacterium]